MSSAAAKALGNAAAFHAIFFEEADEHLAAIERLLLGIDPAAPAAEDLNAIFRAAHSIKGTGGMLGFTEIAALTHELESLLDLLRRKERAMTREDVDAMLRAVDCVRAQVAFRRGAAAATPHVTEVQAELAALAVTSGQPRRFAVTLGPLAGPIEAAELEMMLGGLAEMGSLDQGRMDNVAGGAISFELALSGTEADLKSVLSLVVAPELIAIREPAASANAEGAPAADDEGVELFVSAKEWRARGAERRRGAGRRESDDPGCHAAEQTFAAALVQGRRETDQHQPAAGDAGSIRVNVDKIDRLVNLVGELVITEAMVAQKYGVLSDLARHTRNLQEAVMAIRMVPISAVFSRFPRLVRELSQRLGKEVEMKLSGEATELDRGLIERITDPLTHLVRNAIDHGLETPEARAAAGKPRTGTVSLSASQRGGSIVVQVRDDGRGLDRARILARAAERGMRIAPDAPDREVWQLVFEPGFSTAETVTDVSGRGVGMDVVRRNIHVLGGTVDLASTAGAGTTVTVSVPLTLAIIEAMTVGAEGKTYVLPLASVVESRSIAPGEIRGLAGQGETLRVRDEYLPVRRLGRGESLAVIVEADGARAALLVDELIGQQQVVVKSLEANFRKVPGIAAATIMGDGKVALILDLNQLIK
jgi:two-component system chemotaxis sensor kinase CheA